MKTPIKISVSKDGAIEINVGLEQQQRVEKAAAIAKDSVAEDLEMRLMTCDESDEEKQLALSMDILKWVEKKLSAGKKTELLAFLNKNKNRFSADLKDWLADAIKSKIGK